jgi:hypothetical protein
MKIKVLSPLNHDNKLYRYGDELEVSDEVAPSLINWGVAEVAPIAPPPPDEPPDEPADEESTKQPEKPKKTS